MTLKTLAAAATLAVFATTGLNAATFNFSLENAEGNVAGTLTGQIFGLQDNMSGQEASQLIIDTFPSGLANSPSGAIDLVNDFETPSVNVFDVSDGEITLARFGVQGIFQNDGLTFSLNTAFITNCCGTLTNSLTFDNAQSAIGNAGGFDGVTYEAVSAVPLPAGGLLLLSGLAGVAALKRRKKRGA